MIARKHMKQFTVGSLSLEQRKSSKQAKMLPIWVNNSCCVHHIITTTRWMLHKIHRRIWTDASQRTAAFEWLQSIRRLRSHEIFQLQTAFFQGSVWVAAESTSDGGNCRISSKGAQKATGSTIQKCCGSWCEAGAACWRHSKSQLT